MQSKSGDESPHSKVYRAPGRVNLIGEHTDYNNGFVMPCAIGFSTFVEIALRNDRKVDIYSHQFAEHAEYDLDSLGSLPAKRRGNWSDYVWGVILMLVDEGAHFDGSNLSISSDVPIGAGLSSSAALEVSTGFAMLDAHGYQVDRRRLAQVCSRADNEFVGIRSGIMDQFISCNGEEGKALLLDCRSLEYRQLSIPAGIRLVICNTLVKHAHASSEYNTRRSECEEGVEVLSRFKPNVSSLRDVDLKDIETHSEVLDKVILKRCRHVVSENARTLAAAEALEESNLERFGGLMLASHESLAKDYEVSCPELDLMVELAMTANGVYGARMTGGGFGGCTINLVKEQSVESFVSTVSQGYEKATGNHPEIYVCEAAGGAERVR